MKSLNHYIYESLLDDEDVIAGDFIEKAKYSIGKYLLDNYNISGRIDISKKPNKDGKFVVDVNGRVELYAHAKKITNEYFVFGSVHHDFTCSWSQIEDLEGAPREVGGDFICRSCIHLKDLKGAPEVVSGDFICDNCISLSSLEGAPKTVIGSFDCSRCRQLKSLEGISQEIGDHLNCEFCPNLTSLKGSPKYIGGNFRIERCIKLTSLVGAPRHIEGDFCWNDCAKINGLLGFPKRVNGNVYALRNDFTQEQIEDVCQVGGLILVK